MKEDVAGNALRMLAIVSGCGLLREVEPNAARKTDQVDALSYELWDNFDHQD